VSPHTGAAVPGAARRWTPAERTHEEVRRRTVHVASGILGPLAAAVGDRVATPAFVALVVAASLAEIARLRWPWARTALGRLAGGLFRPTEATRVSGAATLALGYALVWWLFPVAAAERAILVAAVADPMAATVGSRFGGGRPKSWAGSAACAATAALVLLLTGLPGWAAAIAAAVATAVERAPWRGADNVLLPVSVGAVLWWIA
jgi:dolichol kinase